jgi:hypothetical protein
MENKTTASVRAGEKVNTEQQRSGGVHLLISLLFVRK